MVDPAASEPPSVRVRRSLVQRHAAWLRTSGMSALLGILVVSIFIVPTVVPYGTASRMVVDVLLPMVLISGIVAVSEHRKTLVTLVLLSVLAVVARWSELLLPVALQPEYRDTATLIALAVLAFAVGINVFAAGRPLRDRVFGGIVLYLLLGVMWAVAYALVDTLTPNAFAGRPANDAGLADWGYFSFVTLTTVGYGDITPVTRVARSLAMLEALVGQLYPAIIIARLVSLPASAS
jgi:hypothetical protein